MNENDEEDDGLASTAIKDGHAPEFLSKIQVKTWLTHLATRNDPLRQLRTANHLLRVLRSPSYRPAAAEELDLGKNEIMKILLLLRTDMHVPEVLAAAILLVCCLIRGGSDTPGSAARWLALAAADTYRRILAVLKDVGVSVGPQAAATRFLAEYAGGGEKAAGLFCGVGEPEGATIACVELIGFLDPKSARSLETQYWALEGLAKASSKMSLRPVLLAAGILFKLADAIGRMCCDEFGRTTTAEEKIHYIPKLYLHIISI
ncbi:hypothetical protein HKX48_002921 [Thoreauomyces humboldtii]|nr:hypothetical protein HKX48_002921 [Thoreauomyces humboldtii]